MKPANDNAGKVSRDRAKAARGGRTAEAIVAQYAAAAQARGVATLQKIPTEVAFGKTGPRYIRRSSVDFTGFAHDDGRHIALEVKSCVAAKRFRLGEVEPHQAAYLDAVEAAGGEALLVVVYGEDRTVCVLPWHWVRDQAAAGAASLTAADLLAWKCDAETFLSEIGAIKAPRMVCRG
jgi:penicillin-binding protein-related factor A (putative recombinase)